MINFLMIMEKALWPLGLVTIQDQKIKPNTKQLLCVGRLINILV